MKRRFVPMLLTLILSNHMVFAQTNKPEAAPEPNKTTEAVAPQAATGGDNAMEKKAIAAENLNQLREAHRKYMRELSQKIWDAQDPTERKNLLEERNQELQKQHKFMQELWEEVGLLPQGFKGARWSDAEGRKKLAMDKDDGEGGDCKMMAEKKKASERQKAQMVNVQQRLDRIIELLEQLAGVKATAKPAADAQNENEEEPETQGHHH